MENTKTVLVLALFAGLLLVIGFFGYKQAAVIAPLNSCNDSDSGLAPWVAGKVTFNGISLQDSCMINKTYNSALKEYYCYKGRALFKVYNCPYSCEKGSCIQGINATKKK